jgi:hypothetical protein
MSLEDIPSHYLIMHQFIYQAEAQLKSHTDIGAIGYTGKTKQVANKLRELGWRRADYNRESLDDDGNTIIRKQINRDSFWYKPEHWKKDSDIWPPVQPISDDAETFEHIIRRGRRLMFPQDVKETIMDELVVFISSGKVSQWYGGAGGHERMKKNVKGRLDKPRDVATALPADIDPVIIVPHHLLLITARRTDPQNADSVERGMQLFGWDRANRGNREKEIWFNPKQWELAVGGALGLLPLTSEAEQYLSKLDPESTSLTKRFIPDASYLPDVEVMASAAMEVAANATKRGTFTPPAASIRPDPSAPDRSKPGSPTIKDIDAATKARAAGRDPESGRKVDDDSFLGPMPAKRAGNMAPKGSRAEAQPLGKTALGHHKAVGKDVSNINNPKPTISKDEEDDEEDIDIEPDEPDEFDDEIDDNDEEDIDEPEIPKGRQSVADLDAAYKARVEKERQRAAAKRSMSGSKNPPKEQKPVSNKSILFADDDE